MIKSLRKSIETFFSWFSLLLLLSMLGIIVAQVFMRNLFGKSLNIASEVARMEVIWLTFTGGILATLKNKHIAIDLLSRILSNKYRKILTVILNVSAAAICGFLTWFSINFVKMEIEFASKIADIIPAWTFQIIIPVGFLVMGLCFLLNIFNQDEVV